MPRSSQSVLRLAQTKYNLLCEASKDVVYTSTPEGKFLDINPAGVELFEYDSREAMLEVDIAKEIFVNPEDRQELERLLKEKGCVRDHELVLKTRTGKKLFVLVTVAAVRDDRGRIVAYQGIMHDLTKHRNLEEQFLHAQKMENIGTLVGGIAHDFNNLLTVILGHAQMALQGSETDDSLADDLQTIRKAATQARDLVRDLLTFSRNKPFDIKLLDLNVLVRQHVKLLRRIVGEDIELKVDLASELMPVAAAASQVQQILMNLSVNARDALPNGGTIRFTTRNCSRDHVFENRNSRPTNAASRFVELSVADTGTGICPEMRSRIFEPFFTTKEVGKGTGLGLAVIRRIVNRYDGHIVVESQVGQGTCFKVYFPVAERAMLDETPTDGQAISLGNGETILVVEDEPSVRKVIERLLAGLNYNVLTAQDGNEAIQVFEQHRQDIDLVLLDVIMPQVGGRDTLVNLRLKRQDLPIVFMTGNETHFSALKLSDADAQLTTVLRKPFTREALSRKVREALDH